MKRLTLPRSRGEIRPVLIFVLSMAIPVAGIAQISVNGIAPTAVTEITPTPVIESAPRDWQGKLQFHAQTTYGPWAVAGFAAYAGFLQETNSPKEWGQGGGAHGKRFASTPASAG